MAESIALRDYTNRRGELSAYGRAVNSAATLKRMLLAVGVVITLLLLVTAWLAEADVTFVGVSLRWLVLFSLACLYLGLGSVWRYASRNFIEPDLAFRKWLQQVCDGELGAQIDLPDGHRHFKELNFHTRNLASSLNQLSTDMESLVNTQTQRLESQNQVLELLFNVTSNMSGEFKEQVVLDTVCCHLAEWFGDARAIAYMSVNGELKQMAVGDTSVQQPNTNSKNLPSHADSSSAPAGEQLELINEISRFELAGVRPHYVRVPVIRGGDVVGMLEVNTATYEPANQKETDRVLTTVAEQLSLFITKNSAVENAHHTRLLQERANLGAEIHDSLAQTLLATRYHLTLLRESIKEPESSEFYSKVIRIEGMIGEANEEVRGLIREVRKPLSAHRYADSLEATIDLFRKSSGMQVFFQLDNPQIRFTPREDSVLQRIVAEALTNAQKYSGANMIRVYLKCRESGFRSLLIEDDGAGFDPVIAELPGASNSGDHIGLSIMKERALSIGAVFSIDSEVGEGTRVSLELPPLVPEDT